MPDQQGTHRFQRIFVGQFPDQFGHRAVSADLLPQLIPQGRHFIFEAFLGCGSRRLLALFA